MKNNDKIYAVYMYFPHLCKWLLVDRGSYKKCLKVLQKLLMQGKLQSEKATKFKIVEEGYTSWIKYY